MDKLYSWKARRAGGRITVTHSCGKVANVDVIEPRGGVIVATVADGREFELANPAPIGG
jgi:hypothetical protein